MPWRDPKKQAVPRWLAMILGLDVDWWHSLTTHLKLVAGYFVVGIRLLLPPLLALGQPPPGVVASVVKYDKIWTAGGRVSEQLAIRVHIAGHKMCRHIDTCGAMHYQSFDRNG